MQHNKQWHGVLPAIVDVDNIRLDQGRRMNFDSIPQSFTLSESTVVVSANTAAGLQVIAIQAITATVPKGTILNFLPGGGKFAKTTAIGNVGDTTLQVEALPTALAAADVAYYAPASSFAQLAPRKEVPALTVIVLEQNGDGGTIPRSCAVNGETAYGFTYSNRTQYDMSAPLSGQANIIGGDLYENMLPDYLKRAALWPTMRAELVGLGSFRFFMGGDSRVSF